MSLVPAPAPDRTVESVRRDWQLAVKAFGSRESVDRVEEQSFDGPNGPGRARVYTPHGASQPGPVLVWFHGGGFVFGDMYTAGATSRALATHSGCSVVAVSYRLAPEHHLTAAVDDCYAGLLWVTEHADELGFDPGRIAVGGDSAGGGLAALVAQRAAGEGIDIAAQVLVYPATELTGAYPSASEPMPGLLDQSWTSWIRSKLAERTDLHDPRLSAVRFPDVSGLAPAIVLTAGFDPLRDEGLHYAARLQESGVPVKLLHFPGQIHGFLSLDRVLRGARYGLRRLGYELASAMEHGVESGVEDELPPGRAYGRVLWLDPGQRWHELKVSSIVVREWAGRPRRGSKKAAVSDA